MTDIMNPEIPDEVKCPYCNENIALDDEEKAQRKFTCPNCNMTVDMNNDPDSDSDKNHVSLSELEPLSPDWAKHLNDIIELLENRIEELELKIPDSGIVSHSFWTRAWSVIGHSAAVMAIIYGIIFLILLFAFGLGK